MEDLLSLLKKDESAQWCHYAKKMWEKTKLHNMLETCVHAKGYFIIVFKSSSVAVISMKLNFSTSSLSMFGVMNVGRLSPIRMFVIPK